jgi:hypothetical protein
MATQALETLNQPLILVVEGLLLGNPIGFLCAHQERKIKAISTMPQNVSDQFE